MALIKQVDTNYGIQASYHRLRKVELDADREELTITTAIYISEQAKQAGAAPLWHEYTVIPFSELAWDPRQAFYPLLRDYIQSYVKGATDSIDPGIQLVDPVFELIPLAKNRDLTNGPGTMSVEPST